MCKQLLETHGRGGQGRQIQKPCDIAQESEAHVEAGSSYIYISQTTVYREFGLLQKLQLEKALLILVLRPVGRWLKLGKKCWDEGLGMLLGRTGALLGFAVPFIEFAAGQWHSSTLWGTGSSTAVCC